MTPGDLQWLKDTIAAATAQHIFPVMAGCEAALESDYGQSTLSKEGNNLFGMKQHIHPVFGTLSLPTKEFLEDRWVPAVSGWVEYPNIPSCFKDRMDTLIRLAPYYPHYAKALMAPTPQVYVQQVSQSWSTDPERANKVLQIYTEFLNATAPASASTGIDLSIED